MSRRDDVMLNMKMLEEGIVPWGHMVKLEGEIAIGLESLPPEERAIAKRKFRKLWKKALKERKAWLAKQEGMLPKRERRRLNRKRREIHQRFGNKGMSKSDRRAAVRLMLLDKI